MKRAFEVVRGKDPATIQLPKRATAYSAGYDFFVSETREIPARGTALLPTGVKAKMPQGEVLLLFIRSSLGIKRGLTLANGVGVIDADYYGNPSNDGEISIAIRNCTDAPITIEKGERVAQGIFVPYAIVDDDDVETTRQGGFGSSGK